MAQMARARKRGKNKENEEKKSGKKWVLLIIILILLLLLISSCGYFGYRYFFGQKEPIADDTQQTDAPTTNTPTFAANASVGSLPGKTREEIEAELQQKMDESMVAYSINSVPTFENGTAEGDLMLEARANNLNYLEFVIHLDETGEEIYRSGLMEPNQYIVNDRLLVDLDAGEYPATVDITIYDMETFEARGMTQAGICITVLN